MYTNYIYITHDFTYLISLLNEEEEDVRKGEKNVERVSNFTFGDFSLIMFNL